jgi:hypothetical protein
MSASSDTFLLDVASSIGDFLYHISPALVTVVVGGFILQRFFVSRANEAALIDYFMKELDSLRADSLEYWNLDCKAGGPECREKAAILEQKMKGAIKSLSKELNQYSKHYRKKIDFVALMVEVSDACTGGEFESIKRTRDRGRYLMVVNAIHRVKAELRLGKL